MTPLERSVVFSSLYAPLVGSSRGVLPALSLAVSHGVATGGTVKGSGDARSIPRRRASIAGEKGNRRRERAGSGCEEGE